ncbi:hypothetical protein POPTR_010G155600v4 [Populus trichocarpa]|uniref:Uncharacterized protein n=1 Tax=Populus trichocarpa TaxID=3694 RepID=A0ACC0SFL8_POPTR|nr:hypothetical protein POPTR_010G155600v4 [Populus trichocarpa]
MAKLYLKLFPKLVSSLAVLLLCQFGYVACQPTGFSDSRLPADEERALEDLMTTLGFQQISRSSCDNNFQGMITCNCTYENSTVCHVTGLDLSNLELDGQIQAEALTSLVFLKRIDLSKNQLDGSIPVTMGNLPSLTSLDLSTNFFKGSIPSSLVNLSSLQYLRLSRNFLNGSIPSSLGNLSSLKYLNLKYNMLSGQIPKELGNLSNLQLMYLGSNELTGQLPPELGRLRSLGYLDLNSNKLSGELPGNYASFTSELERFSVAGNRLTGQVPSFIANWTELYYLSLSGNDFEGRQLPLELLFNMSKLKYLFLSDVRSSAGFPFPKNANMTEIRRLVIRNCSISGEIPPDIGDWSSLKYLDLSFNSLTGGIPDSMKKLNLSKMFLTGNMLSGTVPPWLPHKIEDKADLSYNDFDDGPKQGEGKLNISQPNRNYIRDFIKQCRGKPKYDSLYINCGGGETVVDGKVFEADSTTSNYHSAPRKNWAYSCSGDFGSKTYDSSDYIKNEECGVCDSAGTQLYNSSRLCPLSLTYYGFCLFKGYYTVKLYFAETVYQNDEDYSNSGKRVFDVYIQGKRELKDFNIKENATGTNKTWTASFTAYVGDDHLLNIHFFWAGKGSFQVPGFSYSTDALSLNGPLVSGISVTANFKVGTGLSPSQIAGITAGSVFAPLLLLAFMWKMGWLRKSELDEITIEVQGKSFTLKQMIDATRKFSPKMEIGRGRFGIVYKAELPNEIKLAVKKISPHSKQQGKDELQREIFNLKSLHHENLVQLLDGYSNKGLHLLVYDYMHKGSLHRALFEPNSTTKLDWRARFDICLGIARGLKYLHEEKRFKIVHGNIKPSNIMLDNSLTAKLSDFGLATLCDEEDPFMAIKAKGSRVYMAPEYSMGKAITVKADVYSFGVVLLEIVSGKVSADYTPNQEAEFLLDKAGVLHDKGRILELVDKKLASSYNRKQALTVLLLAMKCVNLSPTLRPKMSEVVSVLEGEKRIDEISECDTPSTNIGGLCGACSRVLEIEPIS